MSRLPSIEPGKRALISGRTGTGKSTLACWFLRRSNQHWIIFNPKLTAAYKSLPDAHVITKFDSRVLDDSIKRHKFTILNFSTANATFEFMDAVLLYLHESYENIGVLADELYTLHAGNARAGDGLIAYLTRGREKKQSFLGLTQRPAWLSKFLFSESDYIGALDLRLPEDRKRLYDMTGQSAFRRDLTAYNWLWYIVATDALTLYGPVPRPSE